ncbi:amidohydrolase [Reichenbachiella agarivorans]|uniref:Amidohydrolase n=1 Tax=Reichenbachiella agarivorans TaxID=2979464 RepID=A0ABY6CJV3_9BACT|nr:amidohydrolase [Reichenbachiella agarivorans]UXP30800.1 amidohydrolase [Reichenbachiella agarivorans]
MKLSSPLVAIIMVTLFVSCIDRHPVADMIIFNATIHTLSDKEPKAEALAVKDGKIVYVGNNLNANTWLGDSTEVLDLKGKTVVPGFIDGHAHMMDLGFSFLNLDLSKAKSYPEIIQMVKSKVDSSKKGEWIIGEGWHQDKWDSLPSTMVKGFPVHDSLSLISPNNPVVLMHASGHVSLINERAMKRAKISAKTENPIGGEIIKTEEGAPTGILNESAQRIINKIIPQPSDEKKIEALNLAIEECLSNGITALHDARVSQKTITLYESFLANKMLKIRIYAMLDGSDEALLKHWFQNGPKTDSEFLTVRAIKLYADGALGSRGALLLEEYTDAPGETGLKIASSDHILRVSQEAYAKGFQIATHCIGDRANREILNIYKIVLQSDTTKANPRFRIEHAQHISTDDIPRFGQLGVIPSMQAIHMSSDRPWAIDRLGEERINEGAYVWRKLIDSGATIVNGTDAPVEPINPIANFYASVSRKTLEGEPEDGYEPDQKMTRMEALKSMTCNNAYGSFQEDIKGKIEIGKLADFTILSQDILTVKEQEILQTQIEYTIVNGEVMYKR